MDIFWVILGWVVAGFYLNRYYYVKRQLIKYEQVKDLSVCSCGHAYSKHTKDGKCNVAVRVKNYDRWGAASGHKYAGCACVNYDGVPPAHIYMKDI